MSSNFRQRFSATAFWVVLLSFMAPKSLGQAVYGSILGTVSDPQGAPILGAKVSILNQRKGTSDQAFTNQSGNYSVTHLIPDIYTVRVEMPGFRVSERRDVTVSVDTGARVDIQLQVGQVTEQIEITGEPPQLETDRSDVATTFDKKYVEDLPILNRNFTEFELLSAGAQLFSGFAFSPSEVPQGGSIIFVNGQHFSGTSYELDGTDNQDPILGTIVVNPNLDAVTETKITSQNYDAEFGKAIAGVVTTQSKSGSNDFHGGAFWFRRTDATQARDPFTQSVPNPLTGRFIPSSRWQQFGGTLGGPLVKEKLFFFGDYQGTRQSTGISQLLTIPTAQVLSTCLAPSGFCNLSQYGPVSAGGNGTISGSGLIYDPATGNSLTGAGRTPFCGPAGCATQPDYIPVNRLSPQALNILKLFPQPSNGKITANFVASGSGPFVQNGLDTRFDYQASQSLRAFGRFSLDYYSSSGKGALGALGGPGFGPTGLAGTSIIHNYSVAAGFSKLFNTTLLSDFRFGYFKYNPHTHKLDEGTNPATAFGIPGLNMSDLTTSGLPAFFMDPSGTMLSNFGEGLNVGACNCPLIESEQQFQFVNNWTKMMGNHQVKWGEDIRYAMNLRVPSDFNRTGELTFSRLGTSGGTTSGDGGLDLATFLLGDVSSFNRYVSTSTDAAERQKRLFFYGQDTWRITSKFTLNYGLRWEIYFPETVNGKGQGGFANITEGIIRVAGYGPYGTNGNVANTWKPLAPRVGIAYEITQKTVVRMGYGRSFDLGAFGSNFGHVATQTLPVLAIQSVTASDSPFVNNPNATNSNIAAFTLAEGPPGFVFPQIPSNGAFPLQGPSGNIDTRIRPPLQRLPTLDAWNATVQHQVTKTISIEAAYVGNKGTHTFVGFLPFYNVNQPSIIGFAQGVPQAQRRPFYNRFVYPNFIDPATGNPLTCCSSDLNFYYGNDASNNYEALQLKAEKRFSQGIQFIAHYTYSHANDYDTNYYAPDPRIVYGPNSQFRNHLFVSNIVYELPFGKGKMFGGNAGGVENLVLGGWQLTSITNWGGGLPWTPTFGECGAEEDVGICRPNKGTGPFHIGAGHFDPITHTVRFFAPVSNIVTNPGGPFADPGIGNLGNIGANTFRGPRIFTSDLSVMKDFPIGERLHAQLRMDAFNVFNHPVLGFNTFQGNTCIDCGGSAGQITSLQFGTTMRELQFAVRLTF